MNSRKVFISHATADETVVPLLARLFEVHGDEPWFAGRDLRGSEDFPPTIRSAVERADAFVVVVSHSTPQSRWVPVEITRFRTLKPEAPLVPLVLDDFPPGRLGDVCPELAGIRAVRCAPGLLEGFRNLFAALGRDFLSRSELLDRRRTDERRQGHDRRVADAHQRLSVGLFITYTRDTGDNLARATHLAVTDLDALRPAVLREMSKYAFHDPRRQTDVAPELVVDAALHHVRTNLIRHGATDALQALRMVSAYAGEHYRIGTPERRQAPRRREAVS